MTNCKAVSAEKSGGKKNLTVQNLLTGRKETVEAEEIFVAAGTLSNSDTLRLENTDIQTDEKGWIITNEFLETTQKNVYAIGDINGKYQFRHKANYEAEVLIHNLFSEQGQERGMLQRGAVGGIHLAAGRPSGLDRKGSKETGQKILGRQKLLFANCRRYRDGN